ncbi:MAG: type II toxin-antitoxin system HicB family antitoxin [Acidobacteriota bacterium]|jgi:predicted RNase H-like HicB family nuclease
MRYTVILEPTNEEDRPGWYYAHVPTLDLTTHGLGLEGAMDAARDLVTGWIEELRNSGKEIPVEKQGFISQIEIPDNAIYAA